MGKLALVRVWAWITRGGARGADVTADAGGGANVTAEAVYPPGYLGRPLRDDYAALVPGPGTGRALAVGYVDPKQGSQLNEGEVLIYSRDSAGVVKASVLLQADGSAVLFNGTGAIILRADGVVTLNGVAIDTAGNITTSGAVAAPSVVAAGKELAGHVHLAGTPPGNTGPNL